MVDNSSGQRKKLENKGLVPDWFLDKLLNLDVSSHATAERLFNSSSTTKMDDEK